MPPTVLIMAFVRPSNNSCFIPILPVSIPVVHLVSLVRPPVNMARTGLGRVALAPAPLLPPTSASALLGPLRPPRLPLFPLCGLTLLLNWRLTHFVVRMIAVFHLRPLYLGLLHRLPKVLFLLMHLLHQFKPRDALFRHSLTIGRDILAPPPGTRTLRPLQAPNKRAYPRRPVRIS